MASEALNKYMAARYERWLDYSRFLCSQAGMAGEELDVLNEVLAMLLERPADEMDLMLGSRKGEYTELDYYVLRTIRLNVTSDTAPYRHKYRTVPVDTNVDWRRLNIADEGDDGYDSADYIRDRTQRIRDMLAGMHLSERAVRIFTWKFFAGESFSDWPGPEGRKELYEVYKRIFRLLMDKKNGGLLI